GADDPKPLPGFIARQTADTHVEADPVQSRRDRLHDGLEEYECHDTARLSASCPAFAVAARLRSQVAASSVRADSIAIIGSILCVATACGQSRVMVLISTNGIVIGYLGVPRKRVGANDRSTGRDQGTASAPVACANP